MTWQSGPAHNTPKTIRRILRRDGGICHVCGGDGANQVDHVIPLSQGGADHDSNRAAIHETPCHQAKTQREALAKNWKAKPRTREAERHPGAIGPGGGKPPADGLRTRGA